MGDHEAAKGLAALRKGDPAGALAHFEALVAADPAGLPGHFLRVEAVDRLGDRPRAKALLAELIARFPFAEGACQERRALIALREGDRAAAITALTRALEVGWTNRSAVQSDPAFTPFAADPELLQLLERAHPEPVSG